MGRPLRVLNTSDLAEMSDAEIKGRIVPLILDKFAQEAGTSLRGNIHLNTGHDLSGGIGNGSNTIRNNDFFLVEIRTSAAFTAIIKGISVTF